MIREGWHVMLQIGAALLFLSLIPQAIVLGLIHYAAITRTPPAVLMPDGKVEFPRP